MPVKISALDFSDVSALFDLYDTYDRPVDDRVVGLEAKRLVEKIRGQGAEIFVAKKEALLVGTYSLYVCHNLARSGRPFAVIEHVVCHPNHRREGIGKQLMRHGIEQSKQKDCYKVFLNTGASRVENHAFYEACGFNGDKRGYQVRFGI